MTKDNAKAEKDIKNDSVNFEGSVHNFVNKDQALQGREDTRDSREASEDYYQRNPSAV